MVVDVYLIAYLQSLVGNSIDISIMIRIIIHKPETVKSMAKFF